MTLAIHKRSFQLTGKPFVASICATAICAATFMVAQADTEFTRRAYIGAGIGVTQLDPETPNSSITVSEKADTGFHVVAGYDFTSRLSAEIYYADLGAAEIAFLGTDVGDISYKVFGLSGIAYLFNSRSGFRASANSSGMGTREGLSLYGRVGIGGVSADSTLDYKINHKAHLALGLGAEYGFKNGFAIRGEYRAMDADQQYASLSIVKRFGKVSSGVPVAAIAIPAAVVPERKLSVEPKPAPIFSGIPAVYFAFDMSNISQTAAEKLDEVVALLGDSDAKLSLEGHTDWIAVERYNYDLSLRRAENVRHYLESKGIDRSRMTLRGFGETRPMASNETADGRATNRRVDIRIN